MKEAITEVVAAGAFVLAPHHMDQPAAAEPAPHVEVLTDDKALVHDRCDSPENPEPASATSIPVQAAAYEMFDPNSVSFWFEVAGGGAGLGAIGSFLTSRGLKASLRKRHEAIKNDGTSAHAELSNAIEAAREQAAGLRDDDVTALRKLIAKHGDTADKLFEALGNTDAERNEEYGRLFPLKDRLARTPNTAHIIEVTASARKRAKELQAELNKVQTDLTEIDGRITGANSLVDTLRAELGELIQKGWDVSAYNQRVIGYAGDIETARIKWGDRYLEEPVAIIKTAAEKLTKLREKTANLEPRRANADEAYNAQANRIVTATATAEMIRGRLTSLSDAYNPACLAGFENAQDELLKTYDALLTAHKTAGTLTGEQGKSVEAVKQSEKLNAAFDKNIGEIQALETSLLEREQHLAELAAQLPRKIGALNSQYNRATELANDPDVEGDTVDAINSYAQDVAKLTDSLATNNEERPDYLGIEQSYLGLASEVGEALSAATSQKQEMNDLRGTIPQLIDGYNNLVTVIKNFDDGTVRLQLETRNSIKQLKAYEFAMAPDRKGLRRQEKYLKELVKYTNRLMRQAEEEAGEDHPLLAAAKIAGGIALTIAGIDLLD